MNIEKNNIFEIFHEDYEGKEIKKIFEIDKLNLNNEIKEGKNLFFALSCNLNLKNYFPLLKKKFEKLGKNIKELLNKKDDYGNTLLNYVIVNLPHILNNLDTNNNYSKDDISIIEDKCIDNIEFLVNEGCDLNIETNDKNYLEYLNSNLIINDNIVNLLNYKNYVFKLCNYLLDNGIKPRYNDDRNHLLIFGVCENGNLELLKLLIENGADINTKFNNKNLYDISQENNHTDIIKFLIKKKPELSANKDFKPTTKGISKYIDNSSIFIKRINKLKIRRNRIGKSLYNQNMINNNINNNNINNNENNYLNNEDDNNQVSKNLNELNTEERLQILRNKYLKTNKFKNLKLKMVRKQ